MNSKNDIFKNIKFVLSHTSHPGNIGSSARAIKTMGFAQLSLINPEKFPHEDADALASSAKDLLQHAQVASSLEEVTADCNVLIGLTARKRELTQEHLSIEEIAQKIIELKNNKFALLFGNETSGLKNEEIQHCHYLAYIDANKKYSSLNLSQAVQVTAYELRKNFNKKEFDVAIKEKKLATFEEQNGFYEHLESTLNELGFLEKIQGKRLMHRLRLMFNRIQMDEDEVNILRGILNQISKKID